MLDLKWIRDNIEALEQGMKNKNTSFDGSEFIRLDAERRQLLTEVETLKSQRNTVSDQIGELKRNKEDTSALMASMKDLSQTIKDLDRKASEVDEHVLQIVMAIPNMPHASAPVGLDEAANVVVEEHGSIPTFDFEIKDHQDLGEALDILDLERGAKITGSGFPLYKGAGARLERALINFMLDVHTKEHGYTELATPFIVNRATMTGTGQLPKMADDMYHVQEDDLFLIPTAEVPVTNVHRDEVLQEEDLPYAYAAYTPCFRREAGAYGKDTRGISRVHQFDKVELVRLVKPEESYRQLELLRGHAEKIIQLLDLPYRVLELCTGDLSFAAAKCYDLEVWSPGQNKYLEVSSCSNFEDFQARRMALKYKPSAGGKAQLLHTINGSGLALARIFITILENYQEADGRVRVPEVLRPYIGIDYIS